VSDLIARLELLPHPEGGYYRETYRSAFLVDDAALPAGYTGPRCLGTAIYFLLAGQDVSRLHRLRGDEVWFFHAGCGLTLHLFDETTGYRAVRLGPVTADGGERGQTPQVMVPAGCWFGATVDDPRAFALVGCAMAPGFDFADFELGTDANLRRRFPDHVAVLDRLCPREQPQPDTGSKPFAEEE